MGRTLFGALAYIIHFFLFFFLAGPKVCGILVPQPGFKLAPPALEHGGLTTGLPVKSLTSFSVICLTDYSICKFFHTEIVQDFPGGPMAGTIMLSK